VALSVGGNGQSTVYSGQLSGAGSLTKLGTGTLTLTGANAYLGLTTVKAGTLELGPYAQGVTGVPEAFSIKLGKIPELS
jgi:autotransporter-associated beta strand protein